MEAVLDLFDLLFLAFKLALHLFLLHIFLKDRSWVTLYIFQVDVKSVSEITFSAMFDILQVDSIFQTIVE